MKDGVNANSALVLHAPSGITLQTLSFDEDQQQQSRTRVGESTSRAGMREREFEGGRGRTKERAGKREEGERKKE